MKEVIVSWSGGKDSCFACYKAMQSGYRISYLANTISKEYNRVRFHGLKAELIQKQAQAVGIPLLQLATSTDDYKKDFEKNLEHGMSKRISGVVFGDIHLQDCLAWANRVCQDLGIQAIEPLWGEEPEKIFSDFIESGFEAVVVSTQANLLSDEWVGRKLDKSFLKDIKLLKNIDVCGENGEYHTLVLDGPIFKQRINIEESQKLLKNGYWFLDIMKYQMADKNKIL